MSIKGNIKTLYNDADEYVKRSIDNYRLSLVENLSLLYGDVACGFVLFMLLFLAFTFLLVVMVALLTPVTGLALALSLAVALLLIAALLVYLFKVRLFVNGAVKRICRIIFAEENEKE